MGKDYNDEDLTGPDPRVPQQHSSTSAKDAMESLRSPQEEEEEDEEEVDDGKTPANAEEFAQGVEDQKRANGIGPLKPMRD